MEGTEEARTLLRNLHLFKDNVQGCLGDVSKIKQRLAEGEAEIKSDVKQYFDVLRQILDAEEDKVVEDISGLYQAHQEEICRIENSFKSFKESVSAEEEKLHVQRPSDKEDMENKLTILTQRLECMETSISAKISFHKNEGIIDILTNTNFGSISKLQSVNELSSAEVSCWENDNETGTDLEREESQTGNDESDITDSSGHSVETVNETGQEGNMQGDYAREMRDNLVPSDGDTSQGFDRVLLPSAPPMAEIAEAEEPPPAYWEIAEFYPPSSQTGTVESRPVEAERNSRLGRDVRPRKCFSSRFDQDGKCGIVSLIWRNEEIYALDRFNRNLKVFRESGLPLYSLQFPSGEPFSMAYSSSSSTNLAIPSLATFMVVVPKNKYVCEIFKHFDGPPEHKHVIGTKTGYTSITWCETCNFYICGTSAPFSFPRIETCRFQGGSCVALRSFRDNFIGYPRCIAAVRDLGVISDWRTNTLSIMKLDDGSTKQYFGTADFPLKNIRDVTIDDDDNILVLDEDSRKIHVLNTKCELVDAVTVPWNDMHDPRLIAYKPGEGTNVAVGNYGGVVVTLHFQKCRRDEMHEPVQTTFFSNEPVAGVPGMLSATIKGARPRSNLPWN